LAARGSTKDLSVRQEERVARAYGGVRSPSSGGAATDRGDVRVASNGDLFECKHKGTFDRPARSISVKLDDFEKLFDEATSEGKDAVMALSLYAPGSVLANSEGFVDLTVRRMADDAELVGSIEHFYT
jgi:hypothetical protein